MNDALLAAALANPAVTESIFEFLEKRGGIRVIFYVASLSPTMVKSIQLPDNTYAPDAPVLTIDEIAYDTDERPVMHSVHHYPGKRIDFELVRRRQVGASIT